jgi:AraC-like DNA-binding protein
MSQEYDFYHYLPVNDSAMDYGLYVTGAGRVRIPAGQTYPPDGHPSLYQFDWERGRTLPEFQFILVTDGQGTFESEGTGRVLVRPNMVMLLFPGVWHRYRPDLSTGWSERWISLNGEIAHRLSDQGLIGPARAVRPLADALEIARRFDQLLDRIHRRPADNSIVLSLRAMGLIAEVIEQTTDKPTPLAARPSELMGGVDDPLVAQALDLIWTHCHRPLSVGQIVSRLPTTRRTLERRFTQERNHSILDEVNLCRAGRAKRLLSETDLPIKTVAYLAGFASQERMRVTFLGREGCSPVRYRSRVRKR